MVRVDFHRRITIGRSRLDRAVEKDTDVSTVSSDGGAMAGCGRRAWNMAYGPRLDESKHREEREEQDELD